MEVGCVRLGSLSSAGMFKPEKAHSELPCSVCDPSGFVPVQSGVPFGNGPVTSPANAAVAPAPVNAATQTTVAKSFRN